LPLPKEAKVLRDRYPDVLIFAVHTTGLDKEEVEMMASSADIVTACASGPVREIAGKRALLQAGVSVPVFAMTKNGKDLIMEKIRQSDSPVLFKTTRLPALNEEQPEPLV